MTNHIEALGVDLDKTLYKPNEKIDEAIRKYACEQAADELGIPYEKIRADFNKLYTQSQSGGNSLEKLGVLNGREIMHEALDNADIVPYLRKNTRLAEMFSRLNQDYKLFLITYSREELALRKLEKLGIDTYIFHPSIYGDSPLQRENGSAFKHVSRKLLVHCQNMMFVGDREQVDILPAKKLGITTAIVNGKSKEADYQLKNILHLENLVYKINPLIQS